MCGIAGFIARDAGTASATLAGGMIADIAHRGPEGTRVETVAGGRGALAHARLAIIDLPGGAQPMSTADGRHTIVFNGEIYNYLELRRELEQAGVAFRTRSDTEVLLAAWVRWGPGCLERLLGMFAFAVWDDGTRTLFAARDRFGKKPLVYRVGPDGFAFASELKALTRLPGFERRIDRAALELYLALGYVPAPHTIWRGAAKLPAGHWLAWRDGALSVERYWRPDPSPPAHAGNDPAAAFRAVFDDAVRLRFRSDVPVGLFLSGGLDSSMVAVSAVAQGYRPEALTVAFDEDDTDLPHAEATARHLDLPHEVVRVGAAGLLDDADALYRHYDEPFADSSSVPSFRIARATQGRFKVVLNGDAGDEAMGGYGHYENAGRRFRKQQIAAALGLRDPDPRHPFEVVAAMRLSLRRADRRRLLGGSFAAEGDALGEALRADPFLADARGAAMSPLRRAMWFDRHVYLPHDLMYKMDIALSAFGIEGRSPFLDHRVLDFAQALPETMLVRGRDKKILLKRALRGHIPDTVIDRPKKGFGAPMRRWLEGPLAGAMQERLSNGVLAGATDAATPPAMARRFLAAGNTYAAWTLFAFEMWAAHWRPTL